MKNRYCCFHHNACCLMFEVFVVFAYGCCVSVGLTSEVGCHRLECIADKHISFEVLEVVAVCCT